MDGWMDEQMDKWMDELWRKKENVIEYIDTYFVLFVDEQIQWENIYL